MNGVLEMLIGYTNEMKDSDLAELADWADHHAKEVPNPTWKRAYALIREGADLLLRRRALTRADEETVALQNAEHPLATRKKGQDVLSKKVKEAMDYRVINPLQEI